MDSSPIRLMSASEQNAGCDKPVMADNKPLCTITTPEPSPKRRKISAEEKEKMRLEKEQIKKQKEEEREQLRRQKEEEKELLRKQKEEEKEQLRKQKEEEKRAKEEEKRRREEERKKAAEEKELERAKIAEEKAKLAEEKEAKRLEKEAELKKKEQEQTRIMSFFNKKTKKKTKKEAVNSDKCLDFDKDFLPFHIKDTVCMADKTECEVMDQDPVDWLNSLNLSDDSNTAEAEEPPVPVKTIITHIQTAATLGLNPDNYNGTPLDTLVNALPRRYLQFYGDERPAYLGTYSKSCSRDLLQNPLFQVPGLDYEYDSEADWEDEGEDIEDDEISGDEEMEDDEMADFVCSDDAKSPSTMTSKVTTAQEPVVVWGCSDMVGMTFGGLIVQGAIDPFKDYWTVAKVEQKTDTKSDVTMTSATSASGTAIKSTTTKTELSPFAVLSKTLSPSPAVASATKQFLAAAKPQKLIAGDDLTALLKRVDGSDDNKTLLTELLCKQYPQYTRKMVTATIQHYAERQGPKSDKRWVLKDI
jgi:chromatin assembly factor 1 subunit A